MKKGLVLLVAMVGMTVTATAQEKVAWRENNASICVYDTEFDYVYELEYEDATKGNDMQTYETESKAGVSMLLVNGGFVPNPDILWGDGTMYLSAEQFSTLFDGKISVEKERVVLEQGENRLEFPTERSGHMYTWEMIYNGESTALKKPFLCTLGEKTYLPLRAVVEAFGGEVTYVCDYVSEICHKENRPAIQLIAVEFSANTTPKYTKEQGVAALQVLSQEIHDHLTEYLEQQQETFESRGIPYDPMDIKYVRDLGRFYVYELQGFEEYPILFNKYTGEVYGNNPGRPFIYIDEGFSNIGFLFQ